jgi:hypothetical protein
MNRSFAGAENVSVCKFLMHIPLGSHQRPVSSVITVRVAPVHVSNSTPNMREVIPLNSSA